MRPVVFVHRGGREMASYRYRTEVPANHIGATINGGEAEIVVFSKPVPEDLEIARIAKDGGAKIITDLCDPHIEDRPHYKEILDLSDLAVCATKVSRRVVSEYFPRDIEVIPDPYEFEELPPHCSGDQFLWFGHKSNLKDIQKFMGAENLRIISGPFDVAPEGVTFYSPQNLHRGLSEADFTLFPTSQGSEYKSNNRLLNAIRMGTFPICSYHPSYDEFKDMVWVGPLSEAFKWTRHHKSELNDLILQAQDYIKDRYSPEAIGERWKSLLESI